MDETIIAFSSPLTEEDWDVITDVDFDATTRVCFHTKHEKDVEFVKVVRCKECARRRFCDFRGEDNDFCSWGVSEKEGDNDATD